MTRCPYGMGVDSWNRMEVLLGNRKHMEHDAWLIPLGESWSCCDRIADHRNDLAEILKNLDRRQLDLMMNAEDLKAHRALPELIQVWRGCYGFNRNGLSWSLSRDVAAGFTSLTRYHGPDFEPLLLTGWVRHDDIVLKLDRDEQEVIAHTVEVSQ